MLRVLLALAVVTVVTAAPGDYDLTPGFNCFSCSFQRDDLSDRCLEPLAHPGYVATEPCTTMCYSRAENGYVYRGCYHAGPGETHYGVDHTLEGCGQQSGSNWCFCKGDGCNGNGEVPHAFCPLKGIGHRHKRCITCPKTAKKCNTGGPRKFKIWCRERKCQLLLKNWKSDQHVAAAGTKPSMNWFPYPPVDFASLPHPSLTTFLLWTIYRCFEMKT